MNTNPDCSDKAKVLTDAAGHNDMRNINHRTLTIFVALCVLFVVLVGFCAWSERIGVTALRGTIDTEIKR